MASVDVYSTDKVDDLVAGKRDNTEAVISINGGDPDGIIETTTVVDDATDTGTWIDRLRRYFTPTGGLGTRLVFWHNEYQEPRIIPAKHNTVALRIFIRDNPTVQPTTRNPDVPLLEMMDDRIDRNSIWGLYSGGEIRVNEIPMNYALVLGPADAIPAGTPAGTIIVRTT